jgi:hypothetical protein
LFEATECRSGPLDHGREVGRSGDIGRHGERAPPERGHLAGGALGTGLVELLDDDVGAHPGQFERSGAADPAAGAGDDRALSLQFHPGLLPCSLGAALRRDCSTRRKA